MIVLSPSTVRECWNEYTAIAMLPWVMRTPESVALVPLNTAEGSLNLPLGTPEVPDV